MVPGIFERDTGPPLTKGDGPTPLPFCIKGVIIGYPLHHTIN